MISNRPPSTTQCHLSTREDIEILPGRQARLNAIPLQNSCEVSQPIDGSTVFRSCSLKLVCYRLQLKCVPLDDLSRTIPGVKSTQVRSVRLRKESDNTDL